MSARSGRKQRLDLLEILNNLSDSDSSDNDSGSDFTADDELIHDPAQAGTSSTDEESDGFHMSSLERTSVQTDTVLTDQSPVQGISTGSIRGRGTVRGRNVGRGQGGGRGEQGRGQSQISHQTSTNTNQLDTEWNEVTTHSSNNLPFTDVPGHQHALTAQNTPIDFLQLFLDDNFFDEVAHTTNLYAAHRYPPTLTSNDSYATAHKYWTPTSGLEMKLYIAINMLMGIIRLPEYADYWSSGLLRCSVIADRMTKNRYEYLTKFIHLNPPPQTDLEKNDRLHKIRPLLTRTSTAFKALKTPGQNVSIDEAMIRHKGRLSFKQYMPNKPTKWGIKVFMLNDPATGYCYKFHIYTGANSIEDIGLGQSASVVIDLLSDSLGSNRRVFCDNWFTSVKLAEYLRTTQTFLCGTMRKNRLPAIVKQPIPSGAVQYFKNADGILLVHWHDKRDVYMISTCSDATSTDIQAWRNKQNVTISRPDAVGMYNHMMGGTDKFDQMRSYYGVGRTGRKWWRYVFYAVLNFVLVNSHILWKEVQPQTSNSRTVSLKTFKLSVIETMLSSHTSRQRQANNCSRSVLTLYSTNSGHNFVKFAGRKRYCVGCKETGKKTAGNHAVETVFGCSSCNLNFCRSCFDRKHA